MVDGPADGSDVGVPNDPTSPIAVVGVVGAGLIGGSIVRGYLAAGVPVLVADRDPDAVTQAADAGAVAADLQRLRTEADVVFLCAPPTAVASLWEAWLTLDPGNRPPTAAARSIVMDVSSVKTPVVEGFEAKALPAEGPGTVFSLSHPMAGREQSGWTAGDGELFRDATWILSPPAGLTGRELLRCLRSVEALGATVCFMDPDFHDRFAAVTSHIPHVLAFAFQSLVDDVDATGWRRFSGGSLRDVLRISSSNPDLWTQILAGNARQLAPLIRDLADRLERFDPATDVPGGHPRPLPPSPPESDLHLGLDDPLADQLPALLATGADALHLDRWAVSDDGGQLRLTFAPRIASST